MNLASIISSRLHAPRSFEKEAGDRKPTAAPRAAWGLFRLMVGLGAVLSWGSPVFG